MSEPRTLAFAMEPVATPDAGAPLKLALLPNLGPKAFISVSSPSRLALERLAGGVGIPYLNVLFVSIENGELKGSGDLSVPIARAEGATVRIV